MEYTPEVRRRSRSPGRSGLAAPEIGHVRGEAEDRSLNVWVCFQVQQTHGAIGAVRFQAYGCPHFIAAADWIAERLEGRPIDALGAFEIAAVRAELGVPTEKLGKLLILEDALAACFDAAKSEI